MNDAELAQAYTARQSGDPARAVEICRRIIARQPGHHGARSLLAVCFAEAGHIAQARPLIEEAVAAEPGNWRFLLNLSVLREAEGRMEEAIASAREAAAHAPEKFEAWGRLGDLCGRREDFAGATDALERAVSLKPDHPGLALLLAASAYELGRYEVADAALDTVDRLTPGNPGALRLRSHLARKQGRPEASVDAARSWLAAEPRSVEARVALAHAQAQRDDFHGAVETYRPLAEAHPADPEHWATLAQYLMWTREFDAAERFYEQALELRPDHAGAAAGLARLAVYRGRFGEAADFARRAIESDPTNVDAYAQLALAGEMRLDDADLARLEAMAADRALAPDRRAMAGFTIGDVRHKRGEPERAFAAWRVANELKRSAGPQYDGRKTEQLVARLVASFGEPGADAAESPPDGAQPIFIVGMPRSGTTLLDSAFAAHADVASAGELPGMPALLSRFLEWADGAGWQGGVIPAPIAEQLRTAYLRQYEQYRVAPARFVTDKQPLNFLAVGLIRRLFPHAPIIHIRRDPLETGFSIYRNNFTRSWPFSTSLADIGHYYGQYARLMAHWESVFGERVATVRYEILVEDFEGELRRLLERSGLGWDPACLSYFEREGVITTLSSAQVRKPPSSEMMRSTASYLDALQPLREALAGAGVES